MVEQTATVASAQDTRDTAFFGHPFGLFVLFSAEMWERFSFYGMRTLLVLYLTKHFLFDDSVSAGIYGAYLGLTYALPVLGGFFADRYLGARNAVVYGGILLCLGHMTMAYEGAASSVVDGVTVRDEFAIDIMFLALSLIAVGVGFLKPNISTIVGSLYKQDDPRRDGGFTIFYMGINIGALGATLIVGAIGEIFGWGYGFGLAGIGMVVGLSIFLWGQKYLGDAGHPPETAREAGPILAGLKREHLVYLSAPFLVLASWLLMSREHLVGTGLLLALVISYAYIAWQAFSKLTKEESSRIAAVLLLTFFSVTFWALFEQAGSSINLFTDRVVDRTIGSGLIPTTSFQSLNPGFIILLAPIFATLWVWLGKRGMEPSLPVKFGLAIVQAGLGFGALLMGIATIGDDGLVWMGWLVVAYLLHTTGELCISPVGLSMVTRLTVPHLVGLMMGSWFLATAFADWLSGQIAKLAAIDQSVLQSGDTVAQIATYEAVFMQLTLGGVGIGIFVLLVSPLINRLAR